MTSNQLHNNPVVLDDLIRAYIRFRDWMDYDAERSAYCAKEIIIMQQLFKTAYVVVPPALRNGSYVELATAMEHRQTLLTALTREIDEPSGTAGLLDDLQQGIAKSTFRRTVHYFTTLHEATATVPDLRHEWQEPQSNFG